MDVEEFENKAKTIVEVELKNITTMMKKVQDGDTRKLYNRYRYHRKPPCLQCFEEFCSQYDIRASTRELYRTKFILGSNLNDYTRYC